MHVEGIGDFAVFLILEQHADKFAADMHLDRVRLLGTLHDGDGVEPEQVAQVFFQAPDFAAGHGFLINWTAPSRMRRQGRQGVQPVPSGSSSMKWFICWDGFSPQSQLTSLAGTPTAVQPAGTDLSTTEPAPMRLYSPTSILPRILAPSDTHTP